MPKLVYLLAIVLGLTGSVHAQSYQVNYVSANGDPASLTAIPLVSSFNGRYEATQYLAALPNVLQGRGFVTASLDSMRLDSTSARVVIYVGEKYQWTHIRTQPTDQSILDAIRWPSSASINKINFTSLPSYQKKILDYLEDHGYPFGKICFDSIDIDDSRVNALLRIEPGPPYKIDSIRVHGDAKLSNEFLQRYLQIPNGSLYNRARLASISKKLSEITYIEEQNAATLDMLGTGSVLNLYLRPKKSSQVNALLGLQPNNDQFNPGKKFLLTVDANILLRNALGSGETIGLVWQQLQQGSPRLNLLFDQPYIFHSPFGLNFSLDMYKRDSSYLNINMNLGTSYRLEERKTATVFIQRRQSIISGINTAAIVQNKQLPGDGDVSSLNLGVGYQYNNTDYRYNPRKGNELQFVISGGTKRVRKNSQILELEDPNNPGFDFSKLYDTVKLKAYQFRVTTTASQYIPVGVQGTVKLGLNAGVYQSASYYRNELFMIGGFKLLRGFNEESQFVSQYGIGTIEYRLRLQTNSYFFAFVDGGAGRHQLEAKKMHNYLGTGLGLSLETKAGIINFAGALGKRDDTDLNLREVKIHFGFASYF